MNDTITLKYELTNPDPHKSNIQYLISIKNTYEYSELIKILDSMLYFLKEVGFPFPTIRGGYQVIIDYFKDPLLILEDPNYNSPDNIIDSHLLKTESYESSSFSLDEFKKELSQEAFIQYLYQVFNERVETRASLLGYKN